jgi:hypothetical protein
MPNHDQRFPYKNELEMPVIGLEAEFRVFVDDVETTPEEVWRTPAGFIEQPLLKRTTKSVQLPTGGALYFDGGVIEVVTPVIEIAPRCTGRAVRSLWEQIGFVRDQLDGWEARSGRRVRLQAFSCHVNISFELSRDERSSDRTVQKLALLLAHLLPVPVIVASANRLSTGIGVRPRRERIEITLDFTPDPGLMSAAVALMVGIVRDIIGWPSYRLDVLDERGIPRIAAATPGRHPSRNGWVMRDFHFPQNPFEGDIDERSWTTTAGEKTSLREFALAIALPFAEAIRAVSDPFSERLLMSVLAGETPSLLDLPARPSAYEDVGRVTRWGTMLPELENFAALMRDEPEPSRRRVDVETKLTPPWSGEVLLDRRAAARDAGDRRHTTSSNPARLTRSAYERVFLKLGSGRRILINDEILTPVKVKGWYHSVFRAPNGEERMFSIDQLLGYMGSWL